MVDSQEKVLSEMKNIKKNKKSLFCYEDVWVTEDLAAYRIVRLSHFAQEEWRIHLPHEQPYQQQPFVLSVFNGLLVTS